MTIPVDTPPGIYRLITYAVHHRNPPERLPVSNPAAPGSDDFAELCSFQIRPRQGQVPPAYKANADFGTVIHSNGFDIPTDAQSPIQISQGTNGTVELSARSNYTLTLKLYWRKVSQPVEKDYTVFVHILDDMGKLVAQQDNPPVNGLYPTSLWETGDVVVDPYQLPLSKLAPGYYSISTGLYSPVTGERLRVSEASGQATDQRELILAHLRIRP